MKYYVVGKSLICGFLIGRQINSISHYLLYVQTLEDIDQTRKHHQVWSKKKVKLEYFATLGGIILYCFFDNH